MITAGIDIGSASAKAVLMEEDRVVGSGIIRTGNRSVETAYEVMEKALNVRSLTIKDIGYVVATGYGRVNVPFAQRTYSEIICHGRGIANLFPNVRTLLDIGGQDCKVIRVNEQGKVDNFIMNDKCAAGTGRYLERVSKVIGVPLEELGQRSLQSEGKLTPISSYCAVFAQRDVYSLFRQRVPLNDIAASICEALVEMLLGLIRKLRLIKDFAVSGGVAKNEGIIRRLERDLNIKACIAPEPQLTGALGAAILAQEMLKKSSSV
jgi:(R)-2-hydroxyacyl-CoA dehydratese activating ATPase